MDKRSITTENGTVCYWITGNIDLNKDTLFFMHGMTADHTMFERQVAFFENDYNIIVWDAPCHGESRPYGKFTFKSAAYIIAEIMDAHNIEKVILVGQSLGGYFAQAFIKDYPKRVKGFVSIGSTPFGYSYYSAFDKWILRQIEWMAKLYPVRRMKKAIAKQVSLTRGAYDNMMKMLKPYGKKELCHLMGIGYTSFLNENCNLEITCPVMLLVGEEDKTGKVMSYNREWAEQTGFELIPINNAAHNANVDNPEEVNKAISHFLNSTNR